MLLLSRLKRDGNAVGLEVDGVALGEWSAGEVRKEDAEGECLRRRHRSGSKQQRWNRKPAGWGWRLL